MSGNEVLPKMAIFDQIPFYTLKHPKIQKDLHFRKVHARSYKKHIYRFFISPIVQKIFAKQEKLRGCQVHSPLFSIFISGVSLTKGGRFILCLSVLAIFLPKMGFLSHYSVLDLHKNIRRQLRCYLTLLNDFGTLRTI